MKGCDWDGLHEYEAQFFGFLPKGFTDVVYNLILEEWAEVVEKKIMPELPLDGVSGEMKLHLKMELVNMIGENNILNSLMNKLECLSMRFQAYTMKYVFHIPDEVTLPEERPNLEVDKEWSVEVANMLRQELEHTNELFNREIANNLQTIQLWKTVQKISSGGNFTPFTPNDFSK
uniref:Uncharacterized protein n=1 Tax=Wuchereria bancrofti TaxID=6293 RepID=A0A1I8EER8_WUCBA